MTDEEEKRPQHVIRRCPLCGSHALRVCVIETIVGPVEVGRCALCDTRPCPECEGRTLELTDKCRHCGTYTGIKKKEEDPT